MSDIVYSTAPEANLETQAYWDAANEERLILKRCVGTGKAFFPPRTISPFTGLSDTEWFEASGKGTIYSYSFSSRGDARILAYIELAEGPIILSNIVDCEPDSLNIGQEVKAVYLACENGQKIPVFTPLS